MQLAQFPLVSQGDCDEDGRQRVHTTSTLNHCGVDIHKALNLQLKLKLVGRSFMSPTTWLILRLFNDAVSTPEVTQSTDT